MKDKGKVVWIVFFGVVLLVGLLALYFLFGTGEEQVVVEEEEVGLPAFNISTDDIFLGTVNITDISLCESSSENCEARIGNIIPEGTGFYVIFTLSGISAHGQQETKVFGDVELYREGQFLDAFSHTIDQLVPANQDQFVITSESFEGLEAGNYMLRIIAGDSLILPRSVAEVSFEVRP